MKKLTKSSALILSAIMLSLTACGNADTATSSTDSGISSDKSVSSTGNESSGASTDSSSEASAESTQNEDIAYPVGNPFEAIGQNEGPVAVTDISFWQPLGKITLNCDEVSEPKPDISANGTVVIDFNSVSDYDIVSDNAIYDAIKSSFEKESEYRSFFEPGATLNMMVGHDELDSIGIDEYNNKYLINDGFYEVSSGTLGFTTLDEAYEMGKTLYSDFDKATFESMQKYISEQDGKLCISKDIAFSEGGGNTGYNFGYAAMLAYYTDDSKENISVIFCIPSSGETDEATQTTYYYPSIEYRTYSYQDGIWKRSDNWHHRSYISCSYESCEGLNWDKISG